VPVQVLSGQEGGRAEGELVELGGGGARLAMPVPLSGDRPVRLAFAVPGDGRPVSVDGRLEWRVPQARGFAYGLSFVDVRADQQRQIDAFVGGRE
jgi:hypothetical protein